MSERTLAVLQARMTSSRLPGKVMMEINGEPMIYWQVQRVLQSKRVDKLVVATSVDSTDDVLVKFLEEKDIHVYRGSLENVLSRFIEVSDENLCDAVIRLTGDCPLVMPQLIDEMVCKFYEEGVDYLSNTLEPTFPDGLDIEIVKKGVLEKLLNFSTDPKELEHVTYGVYNRPATFQLYSFLNDSDQSNARWTVDFQEDFDFVSTIFREFTGREIEFTYQEVSKFLMENAHLQIQNQGYRRNEQLQNDEVIG
jgi:spore coat polysaccharide biosynthesis protein SpsF